MEALCVQPVEEDGVMTEEEEQGKSGEEGEMEATFPAGCTTDEDTDEDSEPEPPPVVRRKVSFADAFGLNLVSVKEFDNVEVTESEVSQPPEREAAYPLLPSPSHEFYMCCLFTIPSSPEELDQRLQVQKVELESIELLPGTTTLRGTVRVLNLCYGKAVYARISLDGWSSYFDLLAEYVPGSSDRKTDRFTFKYALIPPFGREGTRVDFCLRYETLAGTFWANNKEMNYVLFCHQKGQVKGPGPQVLEESTTYRGKRSCLKANRRVSAEEKTTETIHTSTVSAGAQATHEAEQADRKTLDSREMESLLLLHEGHQPLVDGVRSWPRGTRVARVQDFASRVRQAPGAYSHVSATGQKASRPMPAPRTHSDRYNWRKKPSDSPQVLTYHQIPLLTLDWQNEKPRPRGAADMDDIWMGSAKPSGSEASEENTHSPSVNDLWETFPNGTDDTVDKETSVCDVWQKFLKEPSSKDHSGLPESEWLQTAASVSPSNHSGPQTRYMASSPAFQGRQAGTSAPTTLHAHTSRARQLLSDECGALLSNGALSAGDHQPAEACVSGPSGENTATHDASQRSQTNSATDTSQEFSLKGATPVAGGSVDSAAECHEAAIWGREGIVGEAKGTGGDQRAALHTADLVTSSGESKATDMTAMPESQNASTVDRISQGARQDEGLSSSGEGEVTGTTHNAMDDTLAFRETIRRGTKDGQRSAFSTARQRAEGRIMTNSTENKASTEEEIFRPHKTEECEISQRRADEKHCEEVRLNRKSENPLLENKCNPNPMEVVEARLESSQDVVKGQKEGAGGEISPGEVTVEESVTRRDTTETIGRIEADLSRRDKDESPSIGRLKTEAAGELMGPVEDPRAEGEDSSAELKERELSAGVDGSRRVECRKLSGGTKGRTAPENAAALGATRSRVAEALTERFGEDLVRGIWEEVFGRKVQDIDRDVVGGMRCGAADVTGVTRDCHLLFEKADNSGTFSLADPRFYQGPEQTTVTNGKEHSPKGAGQSLDTTDQSHPLSELQADLNPSAHLSQDLTATLAALSRKSSTESAQTISSPRDEGNYTQIRKRSATRQETGRQIEDCVAAYKENLNRSSPPFRKHPLSSAEELKESHGLGWWSIYMLTHVIRLLTCTLLVAGFFVVVYLYDFPAFFALYMFSVCWWFYKWRSYRATMNKGAGREFAGKRDGVKECSV
ncbi:putative protein phosphatase 1 regulatory subunit 3A [Scophthalmus maximus]|uniref:CBM21 domain-containing protein n=1 Tax=Scophthalmus maximus TaxID=52904 RepID=A0A2U9B2I6_SCOMX|nr:putative protein phosphatase 1 regulatory subunit 3A [Scophthalmus maximus]